ncbi:MAG: caspase family protein [Luteolibacter sp.]
MNAALLIGVSDYGSLQNNLPGCLADATAMNNLVLATKKFDAVRLLSERTSSAQLKSDLVDFFKSLEGQDIEELFFYFTGHGEFINDEVHYLLSDYTPARRKQTSLANTEIDDLIRNLSPKLTIKIIDACNSGAHYIKDSDVFQKHLDSSTKSFANCYFMFSSHNDEYSYQQKNGLSHFTKAWLESISNHQANSIRYKDIVDYLSDTFYSNPNQTPFFVIQGKNTEQFSSLTPEVKSAAAFSGGSGSGTLPVSAPSTLIEKIRTESASYCNEDQLRVALQQIKEICENFKGSSEISEIFSIATESFNEPPDYTPDLKSVGKWIEQNGDDYFAEAAKTKEPYEETIYEPLTAIQKAVGVTPTSKKVSRLRDAISGYFLTEDAPFKILEMDFDPNFNNIGRYSFFMCFIFSKRHLRIFMQLCSYAQTGWDTYTINTSSKWTTDSTEYGDINTIKNWINNILRSTEAKILDALNSKYLGTEPPENKSSDDPELQQNEKGQ